MNREEILASVAILVLSAVIVYSVGKSNVLGSQDTANIPLGEPQELSTDLSAAPMDAFNVGPQIYIANTPYLFTLPLGGVIPPLSQAATSTEASPSALYGAYPPFPSNIMSANWEAMS